MSALLEKTYYVWAEGTCYVCTAGGANPPRYCAVSDPNRIRLTSPCATVPREIRAICRREAIRKYRATKKQEAKERYARAQ